MCYIDYERARKRGEFKDIQPQGVLSLAERFAQYVEISPTCHLWTGHHTGGRGHFTTERGQSKQAHRVAFELAERELPVDDEDKPLPLDHGCRRPLCVNADHLEAVIHIENARRQGVATGRENITQADGWLFLAISLWQNEHADNFPSSVVVTESGQVVA